MICYKLKNWFKSEPFISALVTGKVLGVVIIILYYVFVGFSG